MNVIESPPPTIPSDESKKIDPQNRPVDEVVARGAGGAFAVAGLATAIVVALYLAFYVFAYLPRGIVR